MWISSYPVHLKLIDQTALISGSTKGIGFAIACQPATEGARVIVNGRSDTGRTINVNGGGNMS